MVKHPVDEDACEGDVEPDWEGEAGDFDVPLELTFEGTNKRNESKGGHGYSQDRMRNENRKINRPNPALPRKGGGAVEKVINKIRDQEQSRGSERGTHAEGVSGPRSLSNQDKAQDKKESAGRVKTCIERREKRKNGRVHLNPRVIAGLRSKGWPKQSQHGNCFVGPPGLLAMTMTPEAFSHHESTASSPPRRLNHSSPGFVLLHQPR